MSRQQREHARPWSVLAPGLARDNNLVRIGQRESRAGASGSRDLGPRQTALRDAHRREPARALVAARADHAVIEWPAERRGGRGTHVVPTRGQRRVRLSPRIWMPAVAGASLVVLLILAMALISRVTSAARPSAESASQGVPAIPETLVANAAPPQAPAPPRPPRFTVRPIEPTYTVAAGDTLSSVAQRNNTTAEALRAINNLPDTRLSIGQKLIIP